MRFCHDIPKFGLPKLDPFGLANHKFEIREGPAKLVYFRFDKEIKLT